jgi:hypothetical protein
MTSAVQQESEKEMPLTLSERHYAEAGFCY